MLFCLPELAYSQVFGTATVLKPGAVSLGVEPAVVNAGPALFLQGGLGLIRGVEFGMEYGFQNNGNYLGADLKWRLYSGLPRISITTGCHVMGNDFGLDGKFNISFPITHGAGLYTGVDTRLNFIDDPDKDAQLQGWIPVGVEIHIHHRLAFIFEAEIPLNNDSYSIIGGGLKLFF